MQWKPIESAPKDGTPILVHMAEDDDAAWLDEHVYAYPEDYGLKTIVARWCSADKRRSSYKAGWYAPWAYVSFGPWDDPSTDFAPAEISPTHWMPLPAPPTDEFITLPRMEME